MPPIACLCCSSFTVRRGHYGVIHLFMKGQLAGLEINLNTVNGQTLKLYFCIHKELK